MKRKIFILTIILTMLLSISVYATEIIYPTGKPNNDKKWILAYEQSKTIPTAYSYFYLEDNDGSMYLDNRYGANTIRTPDGKVMDSYPCSDSVNWGYNQNVVSIGNFPQSAVNFTILASNYQVKDATNVTVFSPVMSDTNSKLECMDVFNEPFRWPIMGQQIHYRFEVPISKDGVPFDYENVLITVTGTDNNQLTADVSYGMSYQIDENNGKVIGNFAIIPFYKATNTTAEKHLIINVQTSTHTFTGYDVMIPTLIGFSDTDGDGLDDRDNKSQEQINIPQIQEETNDYINEKPSRSDYSDGILGSVEYGFDTLLYYVEYPFVALGNLLQKLVTIFSQAFTWMGTFTQFIQQIFSFLPVEVTSCIIIAFIAGTIALIYRMFRGA